MFHKVDDKPFVLSNTQYIIPIFFRGEEVVDDDTRAKWQDAWWCFCSAPVHDSPKHYLDRIDAISCWILQKEVVWLHAAVTATIHPFLEIFLGVTLKAFVEDLCSSCYQLQATAVSK